MKKIDPLKIAQQNIDTQINGLGEIKRKLGENFAKALRLILRIKGRLIISGIGKSGHIGAKIAATLASTGTPSFFVHPGEALHGDIGMLTSQDALLAISNSGETEELLKIIPAVKRRAIPLIVLGGNPASTLARQGDVFLDVGVSREACPLGLAPMASTTAALVLGDALASALMQARDFRPDDFALLHPGGSLGRKLLTRVKDLMVAKNLPLVRPETAFNEVISVMSSGKLGLCVVADERRVVGIITDGDLRRTLEGGGCFELKAAQMMSENPKSIAPEAMISQAEELMLTHKIKEIIVQKDEKIVGIIQLYDIAKI